MAETLRYYAFDQGLYDRLADAVISERSVTGLAEALANQTYHPCPADHVRVRRDLNHWQHPQAMDVEIAGLRTAPGQWMGLAAAKLLSLPSHLVCERLVELSRVEMLSELMQAPWFYLSCCSPLYRERLIGDLYLLPADIVPYDGPMVAADAVGGVHPSGAVFSVPLDATDVSQTSTELDRLAIDDLVVGDTRELASIFESMNGGFSSLQTTFAEEFGQIRAAFRDAARNGWGLQIVFG